MQRNQDIEDFLTKKLHSYSRAPLTGDASSRCYERITTDDNSYILMDSPHAEDNINAFITIDQYLTSQGFSAPEIIASKKEKGLLLLEDLGDATYNNAINAGADEILLYTNAVDVLIALHQSRPPPLSQHKARAIAEVMRLLDWYWPLVYREDAPEKIRSEFEDIWQTLLTNTEDGSVISLFDYHADNLMWLPERIGIKRTGLLDFQDAVIASPALDLAALLQDVRRNVPQHLANSMLEHYISHTNIEKELFMNEYALWGAQWNIRILGTFARLAMRDNKPDYLSFIPVVWKRVEFNLSNPILNELKQWLNKNFSTEKRCVA